MSFILESRPSPWKGNWLAPLLTVQEFGHSVYERVLDANGNFVQWKYNANNWGIASDPTLNKDGPVGYSMEILNAGQLHLNPNEFESNPLWSNYGLYYDMRSNNFLTFKQLYLIPQRFDNLIRYMPW